MMRFDIIKDVKQKKNLIADKICRLIPLVKKGDMMSQDSLDAIASIRRALSSISYPEDNIRLMKIMVGC